MRLIDADKLKEYINDWNIGNGIGHGQSYILDAINAQPTVYDVDKIVEQLQEEKNVVSIQDEELKIRVEELDDAIEIVKQGCVSEDVCEWKSVSDGEFIQNPHTKRLYSNEPSMKNIYCNTCGKNIKVGGKE